MRPCMGVYECIHEVVWAFARRAYSAGAPGAVRTSLERHELALTGIKLQIACSFLHSTRRRCLKKFEAASAPARANGRRRPGRLAGAHPHPHLHILHLHLPHRHLPHRHHHHLRLRRLRLRPRPAASARTATTRGTNKQTAELARRQCRRLRRRLRRHHRRRPRPALRHNLPAKPQRRLHGLATPHRLLPHRTKPLGPPQRTQPRRPRLQHRAPPSGHAGTCRPRRAMQRRRSPQTPVRPRLLRKLLLLLLLLLRLLQRWLLRLLRSLPP